MSEASATAASLHWKLEAATKQIAALTNELRVKDATIDALQKNVDNLTAQVQRFIGVNSTLTRCISEATVPESSLSSVSTADLQGKLEMYRLMNRQYEMGMETLVAEQKATDEMLSIDGSCNGDELTSRSYRELRRRSLVTGWLTFIDGGWRLQTFM